MLLAMIPPRSLLLAAAVLASGTHTRAACPVPGDLAPGTLTGTTWTAAGDGEASVADAVIALRVGSGEWVLGGECGLSLADVAPGVPHDAE